MASRRRFLSWAGASVLGGLADVLERQAPSVPRSEVFPAIAPGLPYST